MTTFLSTFKLTPYLLTSHPADMTARFTQGDGSAPAGLRSRLARPGAGRLPLRPAP